MASKTTRLSSGLTCFFGNTFPMWCTHWDFEALDACGECFFDVHVSGWLRCSLWFHLICHTFCSVGSGDTLWPSRTLERRQVVSTQHSPTSGRRVMRARSCSDGRAGNQWRAQWSCQDIKLVFLLTFWRASTVTAVMGLIICTWLTQHRKEISQHLIRAKIATFTDGQLPLMRTITQWRSRHQ